MNSRDRVFAALGRREPDRVPMLEWSIDPKVRNANGTPDQVTEAVKKCISTASPEGGHILSSSNSIHSQVKPENFLVMLEAAQRFGKYPINMVR